MLRSSFLIINFRVNYWHESYLPMWQKGHFLKFRVNVTIDSLFSIDT